MVAAIYTPSGALWPPPRGIGEPAVLLLRVRQLCRPTESYTARVRDSKGKRMSEKEGREEGESWGCGAVRGVRGSAGSG